MTHTRKHKGSVMTIPQLRKAFDHMESFTLALVQQQKDKKKCRKAFQEEWMKVFHRSIDEKAADAYLQFEAKKSKDFKKADELREKIKSLGFSINDTKDGFELMKV
jgi:cysteinyl-tRNA synthetase